MKGVMFHLSYGFSKSSYIVVFSMKSLSVAKYKLSRSHITHTGKSRPSRPTGFSTSRNEMTIVSFVVRGNTSCSVFGRPVRRAL
jgi:hypothetical protein